jgi:hypothetical protein
MQVSWIALRTIVAAGIVAGAGAGVRAQEATEGQAPRPITEAADRIAQELWAVEDHVATDDQGRPRFRTSVTVTATPFVLPLPWQETDPAARRFRRPGTLYHQEFLSLVTPDAFRGGAATAGTGVGVDPGAVWDGVTNVWRNWQARRARERIEREVAELQRQAATSPP